MVREELVRHKLAMLHRYLDELADLRGITLDEYIRSGPTRRAIERLLQLIVEVAADINTHLVTEVEGMPPTDYTDSFVAVARIGVIDGELAGKLRPSGGLRNALIHEYGDIDDARVHASIPLALDGFRQYIQAVTRWLEERQA